MHWHTLSPDEALARLDSGLSGLDPEESARRLARSGPNRLERAAPVSAARVLLDQFSSVVVVLLLVAAIVALLLGETLESIAIAAVLAINTALGFSIEFKARRTMDALLRFEVPVARVVRGGRLVLMPADRLVPGEVFQVEEGDSVPADARVLSASRLQVNEAPLTGESLPVDKGTEALLERDTPLAERTPMLHAGTTVTLGRGTAVVTGTASDTEIGRVGTLLATVEAVPTPLEVRLDMLGRRLVWLTLGVAATVTALGVLRGAPWGLMIETGIALAIAAVPEGLPTVATIALAVGLRRMARRNALVRRLAAVEALGATTVLCTDKTGTLTAGEMTVTEVATADSNLTVTGSGFSTEGHFLEGDHTMAPRADPWLSAVLMACALTSRASFDSDAGHPIGDPTDLALLILALKADLHPDELRLRLPQVDEVPFTSHTLLSASVHGSGEERITLVKGAPSAVLGRSVTWATRDGHRPLSAEVRDALSVRNEDMASRGLRVIALAQREGTGVEDLTFLGLVGIEDPPAAGVEEAIRTLRSGGIRTVMVTGDQQATARAIAAQLGMLDAPAGAEESTVDGPELTRLTGAELERRVGKASILSRVSPADKVRIVAALQARGEIVAMIGDGVNDAPALKKADIGVAMGGRGTDLAKETAAIVLTDDRFSTVGAAVEEGRVIFDNIRKFVFYLFSCNLAEVLVLLGANAAGTPVPLTALQILWLNLVTDTFPALALALEPAEPGLMSRGPRGDDGAILSRRFVGAMAVYAVLITSVTLAAYAWGLDAQGSERAMTMGFMTLALAQLFHLGNARSRGPVVSLKRALENRWAVAAVPLVIGLQLLTVYWAPLARILETIRLDAGDWLVIVPLALVPAVFGQLAEVAQRWAGGRRAPR